MGGKAIVLIGFMGAGKSTAARAVAEAGAAPTSDLDAVLEARAGVGVVELFERGVDEFRELERKVALELLAEAEQGEVIALGGGSAMQPEIAEALTDHTVVLLEIGANAAWGRVSASDRPLVQAGEESFGELLDSRQPTYEELADVVIAGGDRAAVLRALPSIRALGELPAGAKLLWASSGSGEYPIFVGEGLLDSGRWPLEGRRFCVSDRNVASLYAERLAPLEALVEVEPGESAKTMAEAERVLSELALGGMTKEDHVVALGGGVVGDLAGLCAHLYQRGVPVVQVPTTLVGQVDSAYGGKTGVDLPEGKNYAGAYQLPAAVISDTGTLATLPREELAAGYAEVVKTGLLAGGALWERVLATEELDAAELEDVVFACARYKCAVVAADERDAGLRHVLNLGHTVGHGIEAATGYRRYRHGEAVGLGLLAALRLSDAPELAAEVEAQLSRHGLPTSLDREVDVDAVLEALGRDKKRTSEGVGFVLLSEPGEPRTGQLLDEGDVRAAVEDLLG